jgi:MerR family transcriptional regulator, light-induced transcriptional regulator
MSDAHEQFDRPRMLGSLASCTVGRISVDGAAIRAGRRAPARLSGLNQTIESTVIPSLVIAHARPQDLRAEIAAERDSATFCDSAALAEQMLADRADTARATIDRLRSDGLSLETIYLQLLAPAAVHLRRLWSNDLCGFADAALALWRLQQLLREYSVEFRAEAERRETGRRALLAPTPREKHDLSYAMFCLVLMSEFFRRDGWEAWIEPDPSSPEFNKIVRDQWFDVVEFLVSGDKQLDALASRIRTIRRESPNRSIGVMVYGQVFIEHPELVLLVGADASSTDPRQGALQAQHLLRLTDRS